MKRNDKIKMNYICNQKWEAMSPTAKGRYCALCKKEIYDFRKNTDAELKAMTGAKCGVFLPEQVEEGIRPIQLKFISKTKFYIATFATIVGLEKQGIQAQSQAQAVQMEISPTDTVSTKNLPDSLNSARTPDYFETHPYVSKLPFMETQRKSYYWSKRFPFIVVRRNIFVGYMF